MKRQQQGFTLIELAIVMLVLTILAAGVLVPLTTSIETRRVAETRNSMATIQDALIGYAMSHTTRTCTCVYTGTILDPTSTCSPSLCPTLTTTGTATLTLQPRHYLPCPDITGDGQEDRDATTNVCAIATSSNGNNNHPGWLPWVTLNLPETDAWGSRYAYDVYLPYADVNVGFSTTLPPKPESPVAGELYVCNSSGCPLPAPNPPPSPSPYLAIQAPATIMSYGPNGQGAFSANNKTWGSNPDQTSSPDEYQNAVYGGSNNYRGYVSHPPAEASSSGGQFDDLLTWLSWPALVNRVCPAGGCP